MSPKQKPLVVIIEDDRSLAAALADQLLNAGLSTQVFHKGATALKFVGESYVISSCSTRTCRTSTDSRCWTRSAVSRIRRR